MMDANALRRNLRAVEETRQITNAMFLLSTSRMKRCMQQVEYNKTYVRRIRAAVRDILEKMPEYRGHGLFHRRGEEKRAASGVRAYLILTSDKGMCGAYNTAVVDAALAAVGKGDDCLIEVAGLTGIDLLREHGVTPDVEWFIPAVEPALYYARQIGEHLVDLYRRGYIDEVNVIYTEYENSVRQTVKTQRLLPLSLDDFEGDIITNPPYSMGLEFVQRALESVRPGGKVAMFLKVQFLEGQKRGEFFRHTPPEKFISAVPGWPVIKTVI